jgi:hypothetical protein
LQIDILTFGYYLEFVSWNLGFLMNRMDKNKFAILSLLGLLMYCAASAGAQEGAAERDPFYPGTDRPAVRAPGPGRADEGSWGRDPFYNPLAGRTPVQKGPLAPGTRALTGIIYSMDVRLAIFGGETYQEGGKVGEKKLVEIRRRSVVFMNAAGEKEEVFLEDFTMNK